MASETESKQVVSGHLLPPGNTCWRVLVYDREKRCGNDGNTSQGMFTSLRSTSSSGLQNI